MKIDTNAKTANSTVRGPCIIGKNATIENSLVGPNTSIGDNSKILNFHIEY